MGYSVDTFKTVKVGDVVISSEKIHTSVYTPLDEIILVGPAAEPDPAVPADPAAPSDPFGPVDPSVPTDPTVPTDPAAPEGPEPPAQLPPSYIIDPWLIG
jgi:hypothetical protein